MYGWINDTCGLLNACDTWNSYTYLFTFIHIDLNCNFNKYRWSQDFTVIIILQLALWRKLHKHCLTNGNIKYIKLHELNKTIALNVFDILIKLGVRQLFYLVILESRTDRCLVNLDVWFGKQNKTKSARESEGSDCFITSVHMMSYFYWLSVLAPKKMVWW